MEHDQREDSSGLARIGLLPAVLFLLHAPAEAQSFDCKKASTKVEHRICDDKAIANLDVSLAREVKNAIAATPDQRKSLLEDERRWISDRDSQCASSATPAGDSLSTCLTLAYRKRIEDLKKTLADAEDVRLTVASCQKIADRYRALAAAHPGGVPLAEVLIESPKSGVVLDEPVMTLPHPESDLPDWGQRQDPPIVIPPELTEDFVSSAKLQRLPNTNFHSISSVDGTAHCINSSYFEVKNGRAEKASAPPGFDTEEDGGCMVERYYGTIDNSPALFEEEYRFTPDMSSKVKVATWNSGHFTGSCTVTFSFAPKFDGRTLNDWEATCDGKQCDELHKAALKLAEAAQNDLQSAQSTMEEALSPAQRTEYVNAAKLADESPDSENGQPEDHLPYVYQGRVYVVSLAHFTIGWREFADWSVKFDSLENGKLARQGAFAIGMQKGPLMSVSIN